MRNKFDVNKLNSFLDAATKTIACDADCQKQKTIDNLKTKYENAKSNLLLAEPNFEISKKNYYTYISGESKYNEMIENEKMAEAEKVISKFKEVMENEINNIGRQINSYNGLFINFQNVVDLLERLKIENSKLAKQLKENVNDVLTNDRKTYYEDQQNDHLNNFYYYILFVIYFIVVIFYAVLALMDNPFGNYRKVRLSVFILLLFIPFMTTWILGKLIYLFYLLVDLLPKNVYK
jgi:hypothetical protein